MEKLIYYILGLLTPFVILSMFGLYWEWENGKKTGRGVFKKFHTPNEHIDFHIPK